MYVVLDAHLDKTGTELTVSALTVKLDMDHADFAQLEHSPTHSAQDASVLTLTKSSKPTNSAA